MRRNLVKPIKCLELLLILVLSFGLMACGQGNGKDKEEDVKGRPAQTEVKAEEENEESDAQSRMITDGAGRQVTVPKKVEKIVCVGVGALRYTSYMESAGLAVGVEEYEKEKMTTSLPYNYVNHDLFEDLPVTGGNGEPNTEAIIEAAPEVIVMSSFAAQDPDELSQKTGIPVVLVPGSDTTLDEKAYKTFEILGELYGKEDRAKELKSYLDGLKEDLEKRSKDVKEDEKPLVYVGGVSFKGMHGFEGTEAHYGPLALIGAKNLADETGQKGAFNIDLEKVSMADPDIIFLDFNGMKLIKEQYEEKPDFYNSLKAVKEGKVFSQISFRYCASNLETALADAYYAGSVIFPDQYKDLNYEEKAREIFTKLLGKDIYDNMKEEGYEFRSLTLGKR